MGFLKFNDAGTSPSGRTKRWNVTSGEDSFVLGIIRWYAPWRKYVFDDGNSVFDANCLQEIADFVKTQTQEHKDK
jgi:hypothetical protein